MSKKMSISQSAQHFGVSTRTIHRWIQSKKVKAKKVDGLWAVTIDNTNDNLDTPINNVIDKHDNTNDKKTTILTLSRQCQILEKQLKVKDDQIAAKDEQMAQLQQTAEGLQKLLDQSQQLQAMTEKRYEAEHQQLIEMKARSFWQRLTSVFE